MNITPAQFAAHMARQPGGSADPAKPARRPRGTGRVGAAKAAACADHRERSAADVAVTVHVETPNPTRDGQGRHWSVVAGKRKSQREATAHALANVPPPVLPLLVVKLVRVSPGELDDDNLRPALKSVRDQVAEWIGVDDRDPRVSWQYGQRRATGQHAVEVRVTHMSAA